ncbi:MAG: HEAT repeat domain-containing protein [Candidatus Brocadiae bacterium]|nr:HEAT repeat domain-containing protein [Candidatus Brocadiia bacterium]
MAVRTHFRSFPRVAVLALAAFLVLPGALVGAPKKMAVPDFIQGDAIPAGATHDWTLGATGARGWMYSDRLVTTDARQIYVTKVEKGSPADGILGVGDVILGDGGKPFSYDPRTEMGKALTTAESEAGGGNLSLIRWRAGKTETVVVKLPVLGTYSATAPHDCPKSKRILEQGCKALAERIAAPSYRQNPITRCLNALALLASGSREYLSLVRKEAKWAAAFSADSFQTWYYGYVIMLLSEYVMATGDESVMPGLRRLALEAANGQSIVGSWGHKFAGPDGRLLGYGMMNAPGLPLTTSLILAREAGVKGAAVARAIERSARLLRFYIGKGAVPYGDHHPWTQTHEDNGKCGMASVLFNLLGEAKGAEFFSRMSVASHGAERDTGHTGNFFNILWSLPGVAQSGPHATGAWMQEFGAWYFDLARRWDGTFVHQGPPQMGGDKYGNWDCTGAYLLAYAMPLKRLYLTGKRKSSAPQLDAAAAQALILDGRGWSNKDRNSFYDQLSEEQLLERLASWSPIVRKRAAMALARRKEAPVPPLLQMLESPRLESRYGVCEALAMLKGAAAPAVPALRKTLRHDDLWLRVKAAEALARIGDPAMSAVPELLERLAKGPSEDDPRGMEQRYLCFAVFGQMLKRSLDGVDRELLCKAVAAGLQNQDGRARGTVGGIYQQLRYEEIKPLLPAIHQAIVTPAPSGIMFASGVRLAGIDLLARHRIREGMPLCIQIMDISKWGKKSRITQCLKTLGTYGAAAKPILPQLRQLEKDLLAHSEARMLKPVIEKTQALIKKIENATGTVELRSLGDS